MDNNAYLVTCSQTGETLLIDAANDAEILLELIDRFAPEAVTDRHQPPAPRPLAGAGTGGQGHRVCRPPHIGWTPTRCRSNPTGSWPTATPSRSASSRSTSIHLQGHTPGSVALALDGADEATHLFTGDCLFPGGVGKTRKEGDFDKLLGDVTTRVFDVYDDSTVVYPGHGDDTTLGAERPHLAEWRERGW